MNPSSQTGPKIFAIRPYGAADFDRLWRIDQQCFPPGIAYTQMELSGFVTRRNAITLVAELQSELPNQEQEKEERVVGFVVAHPVRRKYGRILTLDIVPTARRSGTATALMIECEQRLQSLGCGAVYLETAVDNEPALKLYRKLGYEVLRTLPGYYASHDLDAFLLGKHL